ncbi:hypothetical protein ABB37_09269 [Leptomonas pyrrhocoris]|uniref:Uncharacterized protein n=1 Tax=Leptomonas pyrrhocoris TaxID=157538 RepID=A0A0M9FQY7_LEPPY|nr:hypothetical protein ABB37_09269 [Leptomonas pyrrhocoris]KPA74265.1 hypothetical protein ABB37_09269 [Leptomonas pyrrhocoris]|eukprot:XP_015652704.1 hypothetical protein ABB37_09269 [Leptomonas pyrrhocoris]
MSCFTGRDDRLTLGADADADSDEEEEEGDDSMTIGGGSSTEGYFNSANGAPASSSSLRAGGLPGATAAASGATQDGESGGANTVHSAGSTTGEVYRFQSDFRAAEAFCRSHSGISTDGRTLVLPTHNNTVHFQSSEEILLRLQPHLFVAAVDEGGDAAAERRGLVSPTPSHRVHGESAEEDGDNEGGADATAASAQKEGEMTATATTVFQERREAAFTAVSATDAMTATAADTAVADRGEEGGRGMLPVTRTAEEARGAGSAASPTASSGSSRTTAAASPSSDAGRGPHTGVEAPITDSLQNPSSASAPATTAVATSNEEGGVVDRSLPAPVEVTAGSTTTASTRPAALRLPPAPAGALSSPTGALHHENGFSTGRHGRGANSLVSGALITVGFVQMRNSLLFAIKPINPLRPSAEEELREDVTALSQSAESASTATVMRRRWQWKHPDIAAEPPHLASWTRLCTCRLLPLYGSKPPYPREGFYTVSPHQYTVTNPSATGGHADPADEKKRLLEFVLQRLQQQYQIVVDTPGLAAGAQWPRADPSPNARLEMSLGHQTHTLKVGETAKTISVTRMLHRGMYSNGQVTHMVSYRYLLWNYLADEFDTREVHMEAQVGERNAFRWESLDRWLQERPEVAIPRGPDLWMRSREVAVMLLPEDPTHPPSFDEFHRFIGYRFSVHLSTHGKVDWQRHSGGVSIDVPDSTLLTFPAAPPLMDVVLVHDNPLTLDTRNVMDRVTGRTIAFEVPVEERYMSVDVSLPKQYDTQCCYFLKVSWLVCAAPLVVDWFGSFIANASRFGFHAVPMSCYYTSPKAESLTAHYDVEAASIAEEPLLRRALAELLVSPAYRYYPDTPTITRNCRLVHLTGLCCVVLPPSVTRVAQWYQNACLRQGSVEQLELLVQFKEAEARARERVAAMLSGPHA